MIVSTFIGCGSESPVPLAEVDGIVSFAGKPLENVEVQFVPESSENSKNAPRSTATTDANGNFSLVTDDQRPGAFVGAHRVILRDVQAAGPLNVERERSDGDGPAIVKAIPPRFPTEYAELATTPLKVQVKPEKQSLKLELTKAP